ncbi:MAG: C40 family peptidase [Eubacteriales bacterium]|nr:C40 family peptidase [Eubacteriales bacterium]
MKKNQPDQTHVQFMPVRLIDVGPVIQFPPKINHIDWNRVQRQLPTAGISILTFVLVAHLTVGSGAAIAVQVPNARINDTSATLTSTDVVLFSAIENGLSAEQLGAESLMLNRSRTLATLLDETIPSESAATTESTAAEPIVAEPDVTEPKQTEPIKTEPAVTEPIVAAPVATAAPTETIAAPQTASAPVAVDADSAMTAKQQQDIIELSRSLLGVPYVYAGTSATGLDCSGFTLYVYRELFDITLPHKSSDQTKVGTGVAKADARVGDILCFDWDYDSTCDHVAIYIGNGHYVNASRSRGLVAEQIANFDKDPIIAVRRLIN